MASMMDEMARTLARRRAAVEKKEPIDCPQVCVFGSFLIMFWIKLFNEVMKLYY